MSDGFNFLSDEPASTQTAGPAQTLADKLVGTICGANRQQTAGSMAIAIYGSWGSGKTSMLSCMHHAFSQTERVATTLWFEPWRFEQDPDLMTPLINQLMAQTTAKLSQRAARKAALEAGRRLIGRIARAGLRSGANFLAAQIGVKPENLVQMGKEFASFYDENTIQFEREVSEAAAFRRDFKALVDLAREPNALVAPPDRETPPVVIFVDDLDRCSPANVLRMLEAIKNFLWVDSVVFVLALDRQQIHRALVTEVFHYQAGGDLEKAYAQASQYLEKFFLYVFELEDATGRYRNQVIAPQALKLWKEFKRARRSKKLHAAVQPHFDQIQPNLRRVKRVLRWIYFEYPLSGDLDELGQRCAEFVFMENVNLLWASTFDGESQEVRTALYTRLFNAVSLYLTSDPSEPGLWKVDRDGELVEAGILVLETGELGSCVAAIGADPDNEVDMADAKEVFGPFLQLSGTPAGAFLASSLRREAFDEISRVFHLTSALADLEAQP